MAERQLNPNFISDEDMQALEQTPKKSAATSPQFISDKDMQAMDKPAAPHATAMPNFISDDDMNTKTGSAGSPVGSVPPSSAPPTNKSNNNFLTDTDFQKVGSKYNIDPEELRSAAPYFDVRVAGRSLGEAAEVGAKSVAGKLGSSVGLNIPQKIAKYSMSPEKAKAIEELQDISHSRESALDKAADIAGDFTLPVAPIGEGLGALGRIGVGTGIGAVAGAAGSKQGEEVRGAVSGAATGAVLSTGFETVGRLLTKFKGPARDSIVTDATRTTQADVGREVDEQLAKQTNSDSIMFDKSFHPEPTPITPAETKIILNEQLTPEQKQIYTSPSTAEGRALRGDIETEGTARITNDQVETQLAQSLVDNRTRSFAKEITGESKVPLLQDAQETIQKRFATDPTLPQKYKEFVATEVAMQKIEQNGLRATSQPNAVGRTAEFLSSNEYVARHIDDKYGLNIEPILRDGSGEFNKSTYILSDLRNKNDALSDIATKSGIKSALTENPKAQELWYEAQKTGDFSNLPKPIQEFSEKFADTAEYFRNKLNDTGLINIPKLENYVPKTLKSTGEVVPIIQKKIDEALGDASQLMGRKIEDLGQITNLEYVQLQNTPAMKDLISFYNFSNGGEGAKRLNGGILSGFLKEALYSSGGRRTLSLQASRALERTEGQIPDFLVEKNPFKLLDQWSMNTTRAAFLGNTIDQLRNKVKVLRGLGADVDAATVEKMATDILGVRSNTLAAATNNLKTSYQLKLDQAVDFAGGRQTAVGSFLNNLRVVPEIVSQVTHQIYPNVLGASVTSLANNLGGNYVKMVSELGSTPYALALANGAAARNLLNYNTNLKLSQAMGNVPEQFMRNQNRALQEGIQSTGLYRAGSAAIDAVNKAVMLPFQTTEGFNRGTAIELARGIVKDLNGSEGSRANALSVINRMPLSMRRILSDLQDKPDQFGLELSKYFNTVIQQNYNKLSASEYARTMGSLFSAFTKWPSAYLGQAAYQFRSKGILGSIPRQAELVLTPFLILRAIDYATGKKDVIPFKDGEDNRSDRVKLISGAQGVARFGGIDALKAVGTGDYFTPPVIKTAIQTAKGMYQGADKKQAALRAAGDITATFVPGAGLLKRLTDDLPTFIQGTRTQGDNFFDKVHQGAKKLDKMTVK